MKKEKEKEKKEKSNNKNKKILTFTFSYYKIYIFVKRHIWINLVYIVTFVLVFSSGRLLEMQ